MVLSRGAVQRIVSSGRTCPRDDAPDDMFLGNTAKTLNIDIVSSNLFHQVRNCFLKKQFCYWLGNYTVGTAI